MEEETKGSLLFPLETKTIVLDKYIVDVRENNGEDVISARVLLKENRDDGVLVEYALTCIAMIGMWKKTPDGKKGEVVPIPEVKNAKEITARAKMMSLGQWNALVMAVGQYNKLYTPDNLEK